jgi:hypothetical protein
MIAAPPHTQDIIKQLHMKQPGCPPFRQWVMSFQRHNLRLSVQPKAPGGVTPNLAHLVTEAVQVCGSWVEDNSTWFIAQCMAFCGCRGSVQPTALTRVSPKLAVQAISTHSMLLEHSSHLNT